MNPKRKINGKTEKTTGLPYISNLKWTNYFQSSKMFGNLTIQILVLWMVAVIKANLNKPWWDTTQGKDVLRYGLNTRKKLDTLNWNLRVFFPVASLTVSGSYQFSPPEVEMMYVCNIHYGLSMMSQGKTPKISSYSFWGDFRWHIIDGP